MDLFLSTFVNKIDTKQRISVSAAFRANLINEKFQDAVLFRPHKVFAFEGCGLSRAEQTSHAIDAQIDIFSDTQDNLTASIFTDHIQLPFDSEGRITLPEVFIQLNNRAASVDHDRTFQVCFSEKFSAVQKQARSKIKHESTVLRMVLLCTMNEFKL